MAVRQYHLTVFARVDEDGDILDWEICSPGSEPGSHETAIFNEDTDEWESSYSRPPGNTWLKVETAVEENLIKRWKKPRRR